MTVTDKAGHALGHGCARPEPKSHAKRAGPGPPGFTFTLASRDGPPGGYGTWRLCSPGAGPDLIITLDPLTTLDCDHRYESPGHDAGVKLRHLTQIRHATGGERLVDDHDPLQLRRPGALAGTHLVRRVSMRSLTRFRLYLIRIHKQILVSYTNHNPYSRI